MSQQPRCLIIGANGFIGSYLVDSLAANGYIVRAMDIFSSPPRFIKKDNIEIFKADLFDKHQISEALKDVDYFFHSFSATTPFSSEDDPYTDVESNLKHNVFIFEECVRAKVKKIIFISSGGAIYGHIAEEKTSTEDDVPTPISPYGICKLASENYLAYFNQKYGLDYIIYRLTNPYGPRQRVRKNQGVIPNFLDKISNNQPIMVYGDGESSRDYIFISDVANMIEKTFIKKTKHRIYNLGSGEQTTVNEIIKTLGSIKHQNLKAQYLLAPTTFMKQTKVSISRFNEEFNLKATTSLHQGLTKLLNHDNSN